MADIRGKGWAKIVREFPELVETVQRNCDIADARFAREMTMCTYLLEMRELYRWENDIAPGVMPPRAALGDWLTRREAMWDTLEASGFEPLPVGGSHFDPFDVPGLNRELLPRGYVYGGGYGRFHKPHFFLGELLRHEERDGFTVLVSGCEHARDLAAPVAAMQQGTIYLRQESLKRRIWERIELWGMKPGAGALRESLACYGYFTDAPAAVARMIEAESEAAILHELGEAMAGRMLGPAWEDMLAACDSAKLEVLARAVRDNLADCVSTLPTLLARDAACSVHAYFAMFDGMRRMLFPALAEAYRVWAGGGGASALHAAVERGHAHWLGIARELLEDAGAADADPHAREARWTARPEGLAL